MISKGRGITRHIAAQPALIGWRVVGTATPGVSHLKNALPCQDAVGYRQLANHSLVAALADGAGTAVNSDQGARQAVAAALEALVSGWRATPPWLIDRQALIRSAFETARRSLYALAEKEACPLREYATTLSCILVTPAWVAAGQIGDGAIILRDSQGGLHNLTHARRGEYANETYFLTQADALEQLEIQVNEWSINALALLSDGLMRLALKLPAYEPHAPFFQPLFDFTAGIPVGDQGKLQSEAHLAAFLNSERVCARTDDDKSLVLAVRMNGATVKQPALVEEI